MVPVQICPENNLKVMSQEEMDKEFRCFAWFGHIRDVNEMIQRGANIDSTEKGSGWDGWSALMFAACYDRKDVVAFLLGQNASIDIRSPAGCTAISVSCKRDIIRLIREDEVRRREEVEDRV